MKRVELYGRVRHAILINGMSRREAARKFGIDPRTVTKMLQFSVPPGYRRKKQPVRPKLDPFPDNFWGWLFLVAFCGTFSHYCMARAMIHADATIVVPMDFLRVPLTAIIGWLVYSEAIDIYTAAGAALILMGNLLNLKKSDKQIRQQT